MTGNLSRIQRKWRTDRRRKIGWLLALAFLCVGVVTSAQAATRPSPRSAGSRDGEGTVQFVNPAIAPVANAWENDILFAVGPHGIAKGGGIRIYTPPTAWAGPPTTEGAIKIEAKQDVKPTVTVSSRQVLAWIIAITFPDNSLAPGDRIRFHYAAKFIQKYTQKDLIWSIESDVDGDGNFAELDNLPSVRIVANPPAKLRIGAPSILKPGQQVKVRLLVMDDQNNPIEQDFGNPINVSLADAKAQVTAKGEHAEASITAPTKEGLYHIIAGADGLETCYLPVKVTADQKFGVYWGLLHSHTANSDGLGTIDEYYTYGRDIGFLDVCAGNDHAESLYRSGSWPAYIAAAARYYDQGRYVTLAGYEWTTSSHRNVYFATTEPDLPILYAQGPESDNYEKFTAALKKSGKRVIIGKHTAHPLDTRLHDPSLERLVEIQSMWSTSEYPGCPGSCSGSKYVPIGSGQTLLGCGYKVAFAGGGDSHSGRPGRNWYGTRWGPLLPAREGQTAILAPRLDRESIFDALDQIHTYAVSGSRIFVDFRVDGHIPGDQYETAANPKFTMEVGGVEELATVEILRDNYPIVVYRPKGRIFTDSAVDDNVPSGTHWYYLRVTQKDGERAWTTPVWMTNKSALVLSASQASQERRRRAGADDAGKE